MLKPLDLGRINKLLYFFIAVSVIFYFGKQIFIVLCFSGLLAMLMTPVSNFLEKHKVNRIFSSIISVLIILVVIAGVLMLISAQISNISDDFPQIKTRVEELINNLQTWIDDKFGVSSQQQIAALKDQASNSLSKAGNFITGIISGTFSFVGSFVLVLVFTFLFLLRREKYENFVVMLYKDEKQKDAREILEKVSKIAQHYLAGRLVSIFLLAILYIIGFLIVGLKNAVLLSAIAAIVTFIPYVGPFLGGLVPFFMAIVDGSFHLAFWVVVVIVIAQIFQNYFIEPSVVGGSVNISPFFTIFILILGGVVWGIAGIILFLPLLGILKIIFENVESLHPYAYLIGDQKDSSAPEQIWEKTKKIFSGKSRKS